MNTPNSWPPKYFAKLQDGNGEEPYFRSIQHEEEINGFADRIGKLVARDIESQGTTFVDVIDGASGEVVIELNELIIEAMYRYKAERLATRLMLA